MPQPSRISTCRLPRWTVASLAIVLLAVALAAWRPPAAFLNGAYANGFYPAVQCAITAATNQLPFAAGDVLIAIVIGGTVALWIATLRRRRGFESWLRIVLGTGAIAAFLYIWFLVAWGWNYLRPPFAVTLDYQAPQLAPSQLQKLEEQMVSALNGVAPLAHREHDDRVPGEQAAMLAAQAHVLPLLLIRHPTTPTHPKSTLLGPYFDAVGVSGMFFPFTFETFLASDLLWFEYPFVLQHEWSHAAGVARESDANFKAAVATLESPNPILRYSGLLLVYGAMPRGPADRHLSALVLSDYAAMRARDRRNISPLVSRLAWQTYGQYLKAQHIPSGIANYSQYIRLLLGTTVGRTALLGAVGR